MSYGIVPTHLSQTARSTGKFIIFSFAGSIAKSVPKSAFRRWVWKTFVIEIPLS